jgi:hypothetical protein
MSVRQLYDRSIKPLPASERLRLAALILNDMAPPLSADERTDWAEADYAEFAAASWREIEQQLGEAADGKTW